jgi:protein SCO1/2
MAVTRGARRLTLKAGALALLLWLTLAAPVVTAHPLNPDQVGSVGFTQKLGAPVPLDLFFHDEAGQPVRLGDYFGERPVVLTLNYFHCQNLCPVEIDGIVKGLNGLPFTLGDEYTMLTVSIDPRETPADAADVKARGLRGYVKQPAGNVGWHVLTGDQASIDRLTEAVGFDYAYDPQSDDFAHPAGVVVLTPRGRISRYLYGIDFSANDLRLALVDAAAQQIGSLVDRALLVCYHYDPATGRYTPFVFGLLQAGGATTILVLGVVLGLLWRADLRKHRPTGDSGSPA